MASTRLHWNRVPTSRGDSWAEFFALDLEDRHFNGLDGVFVVWEGGSAPAVIAVGSGNLRETLRLQRVDPAMTLYQGKSIYVSWAKVDPGSSAGVLRYLLEALKPRLSMPLPAAAAIEVNLPGRGDEAPANVLLAPTQV